MRAYFPHAAPERNATAITARNFSNVREVTPRHQLRRNNNNRRRRRRHQCEAPAFQAGASLPELPEPRFPKRTERAHHRAGRSPGGRAAPSPSRRGAWVAGAGVARRGSAGLGSACRHGAAALAAGAAGRGLGGVPGVRGCPASRAAPGALLEEHWLLVSTGLWPGSRPRTAGERQPG